MPNGQSHNGAKVPVGIPPVQERVRAYIIKDLWLAGKLKDQDSRVRWLLHWLSDGHSSDHPAREGTALHDPTEAEPTPPIDPATKSQLDVINGLLRADKAGVNRLVRRLGWNIRKVTDFSKEQAKLLIEQYQPADQASYSDKKRGGRGAA